MGSRLLEETDQTASPVIERLKRENASLRAELKGARASMKVLHDRMCSPENCVLDGEGCTGGQRAQAKQGETDE